MRGEDHSAFFDVFESFQPVRLVDERDALTLQVVRGVGVVDQHAEHMDGSLGLFAHPLGDAERVHHAVAVAARCDLENLHRASSLREMVCTAMAVATVCLPS